MTTLETIIVGAGIAGIAAGAKLRREGLSGDMLILERANDIGGTWRDNVYPGVACDIPASLYEYSFRPNPRWKNRFSTGADIQSYLGDVVAEEGLTEHLRFGTDVTAMEWNDADELWELSTTRGPLRCRVLILAVGRLSAPIIPDLAGLETFTGPIMHSSTWDASVDFGGSRVGVVGTGASAVQLVPQLAALGAATTVFQRSAAWVVPRADAPVAPEKTDEFARNPAALRAHRDALFAEAEAGHTARVSDGVEREALRMTALDHLDAQVADRELRRRLTPDYEIGCKRVLLSDDYYPALASGAVALEPSALVALDGNVGVAASGARIPIDVLVFATGFSATRPPFADIVRGRNGRLLAEHWSKGMTAYASILMAGFPNLFVLDGPNAALGHNSAFAMIEAQVELMANLIGRMATQPVAIVETTDAAEQNWSAELDAASTDSVWLSGCTSWYVDDRSGRVTLLWPGTAAEFQLALRDVAREPLPAAASVRPFVTSAAV